MSEPLPRNNLRGAGNEQERLIDLAWLAGLLDGEGWIGLIRARRAGKAYQRYTASLSITTTSDRIMLRVVGILEPLNAKMYCRYREHYTGSDGSPRRPKWEISTRSNEGTKEVLRLVRPFLTEKSVCADIVLNYIEWRLSQPAKPGSGSNNVVLGMREKAEEVMVELRADRNRSESSTTNTPGPR